ncbi:MAG TPA: tryptophan synthase subunit alpha [Actinomycetota bacterium]|nr:tryptophan synthase subunit alpha [Actinomycetota bacterium]
MARTDVTAAQRLDDAFAQRDAPLVMPFLVCGYPDGDTFVDIAEAAAAAGAGVLEIGIPFSDPIMDGPVIQEATNAVLAKGQRTADAIELIARAAEAAGRPLVAMTYYNLIFRYGLDEFARALADAGATGAIVPDLSVEDSGPWRDACASAGIAPVFIAAQTSTPERIGAIGKAARGFVYAASLLGVTGIRESMDDRARTLVESIREQTDLPVAVGIGVSTPEHARAVASYADGVIVGSAVVRAITGSSSPARDVGTFVGELADAVGRDGKD